MLHTSDLAIMKRKLDSNDIPSAETPTDKKPTGGTFEDLKLDPRLLQAVRKEKYLKPTPVQVAAIPLALEGRDILARAKTGSGKTAAYVLPILQSLLSKKVVGLLIVPSLPGY